MRVSFPRATWLIFLAFAAVPVVALVLQLAVVEDQRRTIRDQRALTDRLLAQAAASRSDARPLLRRAPALVSDLSDALPRARATARRVDELSRAATPLAQALAGSDAAGALREAGTVSAELLDQDRLQRLLVRAVGVLGDLRSRDVISEVSRAAALTPELVRIQRRTVRVQQASLRAQRQTLQIARQTLEVARDTNVHAASLDRKFGLQFAPAGG